jgi:hypothetical protein
MTVNKTLRAKGYVPASDIATKLDKHVTTIYRWIDAGTIDGIRVGKLRYVSLQSLFNYLGDETVETLELRNVYQADSTG